MIHRIKRVLRNRSFVLITGVVFGLFLSQGARWTERVALPALAVVMTLSTMGVSSTVFRNPRLLIPPALLGIGMNYGLLGGFILALSTVVIRDEAIWIGFVLLAASPPAVAVVPFTDFLRGDRSFSLLGSIGGYLAALVIMPLATIGLLGTNLITPTKLLVITLELILIPLLLSRILLRTQFAGHIEKARGPITNWCFLVVVYTIVGLNREIFLGRPLSMIPVAAIAVASTFILGLCIEWIARCAQIESKMVTSLVLIGTLKNYGLAGGLALAFFSKQTAVPSTVSTVFMIVYILWLSLKARWRPSAA